MDDQRIGREGSALNDTTLRFTPLSALAVAAFAIVHFVVGFGLVCLWMYSSWHPAATLGQILVNIWWFPGHQLFQLFHSDDPTLLFIFPIANSLLWGSVAFVIWKARKGEYFRFSLRTLLITATLMAATLGTIAWLRK